TSPDADAFGCVRGDVPCEGTCDERIDACLSCDADGDGFESFACGGTDCDDTDANVNPEATEVCDPEQRDEDCDPTTFGDLDVDGDGVVDALCCNLDLCGADCDDTDASVRPGAPEVCNRRDDDCDDSIDEDASMPGFVDEDSDGRGDGARPTMGCAGAPRFSTVGDDCDDADPARNPAQVEVCDGVDNDCDDRLDENARAVPWYPDRDADEYGDPGAEPVMRCGTPAGHVLNDLDCDDTLADVHPGATERCNGRDDDCDGVARFEGVLEDRDGDGATSCGAVVDCDDTDPRVGLGAPERCNGADDDCDGHVDENAEDVAWFPDFDRDGYGSGEGVSTCNPPASYVSRDGDCAPSRAEVNPGAAERCDGVDQDCDGRVDEDAERICRASGAVCREGRCEVVECASGAVCDVDGGGTECIDVAVHGDHCGGCDLQCPSGQLCQDAECGGWDEVDLGAYPNCARAGGRVYCWGRVSGSGVEPPPGNFMRPQTVVGVDDALTVEAGGDHACVLRTGGEAWCFGLNYYGQLGDGTAE
ncbi:MAG: hypothetical protein KC586_23365, partial [Myxococcales bacterium]|nr:hypothetical protein [Myxococcales bacterium]